MGSVGLQQVREAVSRRCGFAALAFFAFAGHAAAADLGPAVPTFVAEPNAWIVTVTGNIPLTPNWDGAKTYGVIPFPTLAIRRADAPLPAWSAPDDGVDYAMLDTSNFNFGPVARYHSGRYRDPEPTRLFGIHDVPWTVEPGIFAEYWPLSNVLRTRLELRHGIGHADGIIADAAADYVVHVARSTFAVGPRLGLGDDEFMRKQFGVTATDALWNGNVTPYKPNGGARSIGVATSYTYDVSKTWSATAYGGFDKLVGEAARSPLVESIGSSDQFQAGLTLSYSFKTTGP